jgi:hypothetical protein
VRARSAPPLVAAAVGYTSRSDGGEAFSGHNCDDVRVEARAAATREPATPPAINTLVGWAAERAMGGMVEGSVLPVTPLDARSAPIGVSYFPADAISVRGRGLSLLAEHGRVVTLFITNRRAEGLAGVGVGDNLGVARARLAGLVCVGSNEGEPTCGGRAGRFTILFVGDPIETITISSIDTGWCLVRVPSCPHPRRMTSLHSR